MNGSLGWAIGASADRTNQDIRQFRKGDSLYDLIELYKGRDCDSSNHATFGYPITGKIGLNEVVSTYARLHRVGSFKPKKDASQFTDIIEFTTTLKGGVTPKITLSAFGKNTRLNESTLSGTAERTDKHKVGISIDTPDREEAKTTSRGVTPKSTVDRAGKNLDLQLQRQEFRNLGIFNLN